MSTDRKLQVYLRTDGDYGWRRVVSANGGVVAVAGEGFTERNDAAEAARRENPDVEELEYDDV